MPAEPRGSHAARWRDPRTAARDCGVPSHARRLVLLQRRSERRDHGPRPAAPRGPARPPDPPAARPPIEPRASRGTSRPCRIPHTGRPASAPRRDASYALRRLRETDNEARALPFLAVDTDRAAVGFDQALDDGQAEPGAVAALVRLLVGLEDTVEIRGRNSRPAVPHRQLDIRGRIGDRDLHRPALRSELDRIADQVEEQLGPRLLISRDHDAASRRRLLQAQTLLLCLGTEQIQGPGDDLVELDGLPHEGEYARPKAIEVQDPSDQAEQTVDAV